MNSFQLYAHKQIDDTLTGTFKGSSSSRSSSGPSLIDSIKGYFKERDETINTNNFYFGYLEPTNEKFNYKCPFDIEYNNPYYNPKLPESKENDPNLATELIKANNLYIYNKDEDNFFDKYHFFNQTQIFFDKEKPVSIKGNNPFSKYKEEEPVISRHKEGLPLPWLSEEENNKGKGKEYMDGLKKAINQFLEDYDYNKNKKIGIEK